MGLLNHLGASGSFNNLNVDDEEETIVISVTRLNGKSMIINALFIESVEETPDTLITLTTGKKIMVLESADELTERTVSYLHRIGAVRASVLSMESEESE